MAQLNYLSIASLDGYIEDVDGKFDWARPSDEVHAFINDLMRSVGTYLYGRRMYETMSPWETDPSFASGPSVEADFAGIWQAADKVVYSTTLHAPATARTRIERSFDPDAVRRLKYSTNSDLMIAGAELAALAFRASLVDECELFLVPTSVGNGKPAFPRALPLHFELLDERRFENGTVYLHYRTLA
jgi:dihydrofolate reductase